MRKSIVSATMNGIWGCVAIVDDDEESTLLLQELLETKGFSAERFSMAEPLLEATPNHFAAILLDINLPGMWGSECSFELRLRGYCGPIIAISGNLDIWDPADIRNLGFTCALGKPLNPPQLIGLLHEYISRGEVEAEAKENKDTTLEY